MEGCAAIKDGQHGKKSALYQQFAGNRGDDDLGNPAQWLEADKANLEELRNAPIELGNTAYGRFEEGRKRDSEQAYQKMNLEEKESFRRKMAEINNADSNDWQSPPSN